MDIMKSFIESYEQIPRDKKRKETAPEREVPISGKTGQGQKEMEAIHDMKRMLSLMEKEIAGCLGEEEKQERKSKQKKWGESIEILREYVSSHRE